MPTQQQQQQPAQADGAADTDMDAAADAAAAGGGALSLLQLPSPATGAAQQFLLGGGDDGSGSSTGGGAPLLSEVNRVRHEFAAWIVGGRVVPDGGAYLATPVDPTYVLLALLDARRAAEEGLEVGADGGNGTGGGTGGGNGGSGGMFQDAASLLCVDDWPGAAALERAAAAALPLICDVKEVGGDAYYRLSDARALAWARCKLRQTLAALRAGAPGSVAGLADDDARAYALGFMAEYLSAPRLAQLAASCGLSPAGVAGSATPASRAAPSPGAALSPYGGGAGGAASPFDDDAQQRDGGKARARPLDPRELARRKQEEGRAAAAAARLAKEAQGTKKISSFFAAAAGAKKK